jgi:predicted amidohydrolase
MRVTVAQIAPRLNRSNLAEAISIVVAHKEKSDLILFPELSLSGYMLQDKLSEDAWNIDELDSLKDLGLDGFWGGSCIVDAKANITHQLPRYKKRVETFEIEGNL